jgi:hypothetical protein
MVVPSPSDSPPVELGDKGHPCPSRHSHRSAFVHVAIAAMPAGGFDHALAHAPLEY